MWELACKEGWVLKNWYFWTVVLRKTLESPLDCKEIKPVNLKGKHPEYSLERLMLKLKLPILWPPDAKNWLNWKDPGVGKDWRQEEKLTSEDKMVGWHNWLDGLEIWASSGSWWLTGKPGLLQSVGSQRVRHNWVTEVNGQNPNQCAH